MQSPADKRGGRPREDERYDARPLGVKPRVPAVPPETSGIYGEGRSAVSATSRDARLSEVIGRADPRGSASGERADREAAAKRPILLRREWLSEVRRRAARRMDPHIYPSGVSGLTVAAAADRAYDKVLAILGSSGERYPGTERGRLYLALISCLLARVRRDELYKMAGVMAAERRDANAYADTTLLRAYEEAIKGAFLAGIREGETVMCPAGIGEVRYVTANASHAVIEVFASPEAKPEVEGIGVAGAEIFCEMREVSRLASVVHFPL